jgi:hypothetical protein
MSTEGPGCPQEGLEARIGQRVTESQPTRQTRLVARRCPTCGLCRARARLEPAAAVPLWPVLRQRLSLHTIRQLVGGQNLDAR